MADTHAGHAGHAGHGRKRRRRFLGRTHAERERARRNREASAQIERHDPEHETGCLVCLVARQQEAFRGR